MKYEVLFSIVLLAICFFLLPNQLYSCGIVVVLGLLMSWNIRIRYDKYHSRQQLMFCPTIWTALGILGTFVSIILSLNENTDYTDISKLINTISPAFGTSAFGVFLSMISSLTIKNIFAVEDAKEQNRYNKSSDNLIPELVLVELLKETKNNNKLLTRQNEQVDKQNVLLKEINGCFNSVYGENGVITCMFERFKENVDEQTKSIKGYVGELTGKIDEYYSQVNEDTKMLIKEHFVNYDKMLDDYNFKFSENITKLLQDQQNMFESDSQHIETQIKNAISEMAESVRKVSSNLSTEIDKMSDLFRGATDRIKDDCIFEFEKALTSVNDILCQKMSDDYMKVVGILNNSSEKMIQDINDYKLRLTVNEQEKLESLYRGFDESLKNKVSDFVNHMNDEVGKMREVLSILEKGKHENQEILSTIHELANNITKESQSVENVVNNTIENSKTIVHVKDLLEDMSDSIVEMKFRVDSKNNYNHVEPVNGVKKCPHDGCDNPSDALYCYSCGAKL